jgi:hypothetical protein
VPADVNGDGNTDLTEDPPGTFNSADVRSLVDSLDGLSAPLATWQCDLDRSGFCTPADILTGVDLLNGAGEFTVWADMTLPVCPSAP